MVTVWTFFGSPDPASGAAGGWPAPAAFGGADGCAGTAGGAGAAAADAPAGAAPGAGRTGIVETTRGGALAGWIATGCSSRDTSLSGEPGARTAGFDAAAWASLRLGTILFGASFALITGGSDGARIAPPNIER